MGFVLPGEVLASEEEYLNANNTYVDNDGNIRSKRIGKTKVDTENKKISVMSKTIQILPGDAIEGVVTGVRDKMIMLTVDKVFDKRGKEKSNYIGFAAILVSEITTSYLENIKDSAKIGDIIRGEICSMRAGLFNVTTKGFDNGVVLAFCSKCRQKLKADTQDYKNRELREMICPNCGNHERRKVSKYYFG